MVRLRPCPQNHPFGLGDSDLDSSNLPDKLRRPKQFQIFEGIDMVAAYIALTKPKIIVLLLITAVGGLFLASSGFPDLSISMAVLVGGSLAAGGANSLNHFWDRDIDTKMKRTTNRPVASGSIAPINALIFGTLLNLAAFGLLYFYANLISAILTLSATLFYIFN